MLKATLSPHTLEDKVLQHTFLFLNAPSRMLNRTYLVAGNGLITVQGHRVLIQLGDVDSIDHTV